jgi:hypothetical protein
MGGRGGDAVEASGGAVSGGLRDVRDVGVSILSQQRVKHEASNVSSESHAAHAARVSPLARPVSRLARPSRPQEPADLGKNGSGT